MECARQIHKADLSPDRIPYDGRKTALPFDLTYCTLDFPESRQWVLSVIFYSAKGNDSIGVNQYNLEIYGNHCT